VSERIRDVSFSRDLDLSRLAEGMYLLRLRADDAQTIFRIIKE
ncbi:MAG: T9SS C-terminal target domain-containing protein, partial [Bacteroidetes bacterium]